VEVLEHQGKVIMAGRERQVVVVAVVARARLATQTVQPQAAMVLPTLSRDHQLPTLVAAVEVAVLYLVVLVVTAVAVLAVKRLLVLLVLLILAVVAGALGAQVQQIEAVVLAVPVL
jgi:hypothetical protein